MVEEAKQQQQDKQRYDTRARDLPFVEEWVLLKNMPRGGQVFSCMPVFFYAVYTILTKLGQREGRELRQCLEGT
ncbi:hypothetical protein AAFF_G00316540 [Aldrovandia affinis]|uniref:Uncharacterized protein n=1 Tax=Aldrovandia affinis TaxID=143900 RepID=A0AAD7WRH1_9TELE|nr:hypothetical protein AAFF_G00316540 [Aldrovandia affinis]